MYFYPPQHRHKRIYALTIMVTVLLATTHTAHATVFTISTASTGSQTLAKNETGTITSTGSLNVSGSSVAVTISGNNATLNNLGIISQTGSGRAIRDNTGVSNLIINNGSISNATASITTADADVIQMNKSPASVTVNNYGSMISYNASAGGAQVTDFNAISSGSNIVNNYSGATMLAYEADAIRPGVNGFVYNWGTIKSVTTTGSSSDGIDMQNNSGATIYNYSTGLIEGGRHGITGGQASASDSFIAVITNQAGGIIRGDNGSGINLDGFNANQVVTITNHGSIIGNGVTGDGDGVDVDGLVNLTNTGIIRSLNAVDASGLAYSEGISVGGGTMDNSGTIEGLVAPGNLNAVGRGITLAGNDITSGPLAGTREGLYADATIYNRSGGLIRGDSDSAIYVSAAASGHTVTIYNYAGATLTGGGTSHAAVYTGADNDTLYNSGTINGASSGQAIDMGAGNNTLYISGGSASVIGSINGGTGGVNTMTIDPGTGNQFSYNGTISNFNQVEIKSGQVILSGNSDYTGNTVVSGGTLTLDGSNRLSNESTLVLNGGTLQLTNTAEINGQTFASFSLTSSSFIDLGQSMLTFNALGTIVNGSSLGIVENGAHAPYAFRLLGDYSTNTDFLNLVSVTTINAMQVRYQFDGIYTDVSAVPEADSWAMLIAGLGLTGLVVRRRQKTEMKNNELTLI